MKMLKDIYDFLGKVKEVVYVVADQLEIILEIVVEKICVGRYF